MPRQFYVPDERRLTNILQQQARSLSDVQRPTGTEKERTLAELGARMSETIQPGDLTVTGNATTNPFPTASRALAFPAPQGGRRAAVLTFSGMLTNSGSGSDAVTAFVEVVHAGTRVWTGEANVPRMTSAPAGWSEQVAGAVTIRVPSGASPALSIRLHRVGFTGTITTLALSEIVATLTYGGIY